MRESLHVLRHTAFRRLWLSQSGSVLGDRIVLVATALYVTDLTGRATDLGLVLAAQALPFVVFLVVGGLWADRLPRARLMIATDVVRALTQGAIALLIATGPPPIWSLVALGFVYGAAEAFSRPAFTGLVPQTVPEDEIQPAMAMLATTQNLASLLGPAVGTVLVVGLGAGTAFALDSATFALSALLLIGLQPRARAATAVDDAAQPIALGVRDGAPGWRGELAAGLAEVRARVWVWVTILAATCALLLAFAPWLVLGPAVARDLYGSTGFYGVVVAVEGAGALAGALIGLRWRPRRPLVAAELLALPWALMGATLALHAPRPVVFAVAALAGFGIALFGIWWETALAQHIPPDALSRVSSLDWMGSLALLPVGYALAGPVGALVGERELLVTGGVATALVGIAATFPRSMRDLRLAPLVTSRNRSPATRGSP